MERKAEDQSSNFGKWESYQKGGTAESSGAGEA